MTSEGHFPKKRRLPKLMACMTKISLENLRNKALFGLDALDAKGIRRRKFPLHECLILELRESGYTESSDYLQDLIYDNLQLLAEDDIGIVVDLRKREDYLEHIAAALIRAEKERDKENQKKECLELLALAMGYAEKGKGILWLAEKFFLASIAVSSQYLIDGGRQKGCCKYHYAKFLLDKFPGGDPEEPFVILTEVRDNAIGKDWPLYEAENVNEEVPPDTVFASTALQLHRVLLSKARSARKTDTAKSERLARLAERRARDAGDTPKTAEAILEIGISQLMMNNLNNAQKTFSKALKIYTDSNNIGGLCDTKMHLAAVMQRLGDHETASKLLTEMGALAMDHGLRKQLGTALHLLGELHLRRERPELGTPHLCEAFHCFMGFNWQNASICLHEYLDNVILNKNEHSSTIERNKALNLWNKPNKNLMETLQGAKTMRVHHSPNECLDSKRTEIPSQSKLVIGRDQVTELDVIYKPRTTEIFEEEAEQSRLMMAISAGQELMVSYFNLLRESATCSIAQMRTIEWKLSHAGWWVNRQHHQFLPCLCPAHNRTPLDVLRIKLEIEAMALLNENSEGDALLGRIDTVQDIRKLRSSYQRDS